MTDNLDLWVVFVDTTNTSTGNQYISMWTVKASSEEIAKRIVREGSLEIYKNTGVNIDNITVKKLDIQSGSHYYGTI